MTSQTFAKRALRQSQARQSDKFARRVELLCVASIAAALALGIAREVKTAPLPSYGVIMTALGESYIAVSGDSCAAAWKRVNYPVAWDSAICQRLD